MLSRIGKYEIQSEIGRGGFGRVYRAFDPIVGRVIAIKILSDRADDSVITRFKNEARAAGNLHHKNIVGIFDFGEQEGTPYIVMEFLAGTDLQHVLSTKQPLTVLDKVSIMRQVAEGLGHAHAHGIVHRDVKPANISVLADGSVKIMDFGVARLTGDSDRITQTGSIIGTLRYMAPEQFQGKEATAQSDIFAFGTIFYELLAGRPPFEGNSPHEIMYRITSAEPPAIRSLAPEVPASLQEIVARTLEKDCDLRYQNLNDVLVDLEPVFLQMRRERAGDLLTEARETFKRNDFERANELVRDVVDLDPANSEAREMLAKLRLSTKSSAGEGARVLAEAEHKELEAYKAAPIEPESEIFRATSFDSAISPDLTRLFIGLEASGKPADVALLITQCPDPSISGHTVLLTRFPFTAGSAPSDLTIAFDSWLEPRHITILRESHGFSIESASDSVYVNGRPLRKLCRLPLPFDSAIRLTESTHATFVPAGGRDLPDLIGCTIAGRYRLHACLHKSDKAALYIAEDTKLPRKVAIKVLSPRLADYSQYLEQFKREAVIAAGLRHSSICKVLDFDDTQVEAVSGQKFRVSYICMELMEGGNLRDRILKGPAPSPEEVASWLAVLSGALEHAHEKGVIHAGLKPTSVVFDVDGNVFLTDFAIAVNPGDSGAQAVIGAPAFLAPEQWAGDEPVPATDQYALAAIMYMLVTGSRPYERQDDPDVRERNFARGPVPAHLEAARKGRGPIQPELSAVLERAMAVSPEARYPSVKEFATAFRHVLSAKPVDPELRTKPRIFLSYHRESSAGWAVHFASELRRRYGMTVFVDTEKQDSVAQFPERLKQEIASCDVFVCFLSDVTLNSVWVDREIQSAFQYGKPMLPVFQESFRHPEALNRPAHIEMLLNHQGLDLLDRRGTHIAHTISDVARMIKQTVKHLGKQAQRARMPSARTASSSPK